MLPHDDSFYVFLPSNIISEADNTPWRYRVPLPQPLNFALQDEWLVAVTQVFHFPVDASTFDTIMVYADFIEDTVVGDTLTPLLCTVDVKSGSLAPGESAGGVARTPEQLVYCRLKTGYIDRVSIYLFNEFGQPPSLSTQGQTVVTLHFRHHRLAMGEQRLVLPSNASKDLYPKNTGAKYTVRLPSSLNYDPDQWEVGMIYLFVPVPHVETRIQLQDIGVGRLTGNQFDSTTSWQSVPGDRTYTLGSRDLIQVLNERLRWGLQTAIPKYDQGSWVKSGQNRLKVAIVTKCQKGTPKSSYRNHILHSDIYTLPELLKWINDQLRGYGTFEVIGIPSRDGTCQLQFKYMQTPQAVWGLLEGSDCVGVVYEAIVVSDSTILTRFGFKTTPVLHYHYEMKQVQWGKTPETTVIPPKTYSLNKVDLSVWCKMWTERIVTNNNIDVVLFKRWGGPSGLQIFLSEPTIKTLGLEIGHHGASGFQPRVPKHNNQTRMGWRCLCAH